MRREPIRQAMILPGRQQVSHNQTSQLEGFMKEAFDGRRSHGKREKSEDDPVRNAHGSKDPKLSDTKLNDPKFVDPKFSDPNSMTPAHAG
jgi:hypothetical protein